MKGSVNSVNRFEIQTVESEYWDWIQGMHRPLARDAEHSYIVV